MPMMPSRRIFSMAALAIQWFCGIHATEMSPSDGRLTLALHRVQGEAIHTSTYHRHRMLSIDPHHGMEEIPLNLGMGTHYAWVYAGTPPQRASVIIDTGSSMMAFPCSGCIGCGKHTDQPFAAAKSTSLTHVTCDAPSYFRCEGCSAVGHQGICNISQSYMEGSSWRATVVEDIVYLGDAHSEKDSEMRNHFGTRFMFGCQSKETGLFITQKSDGIMGVGNNENHIVAKLYREKKIPNKQFSLCFGKGGGSMTIGKEDVMGHKGNISYAKIVPNQLHHFYGVHLKDIRIAGKSIDADPSSFSQGNFIVDSGSTDSYLPRSLQDHFMDTFKEVSGIPYLEGNGVACSGYTEEAMQKLPVVQYVLEDVDGKEMILNIKPSQYMLKELGGSYCGNIYLSEAQGGVIGANIMLDRDVIFDAGQHRIGFVDADCAYRQLSPIQAGGITANVDSSNISSLVSNSSNSSPPADGPHYLDPSDVNLPGPSPSSTFVIPTSTPSASNSKSIIDKSMTQAVQPLKSNPSDATAQSETNNVIRSNADDKHPMVLTVVGAVLAIAFVLVIVTAMKRKNNSKELNWSRVNEDDEVDDDDDDDDDDFSSVETIVKQQRSSVMGNPVGRTEGSASDVEGEEGRAVDSDSDDEDEIFDRTRQKHHEVGHDTQVLDRL